MITKNGYIRTQGMKLVGNHQKMLSKMLDESIPRKGSTNAKAANELSVKEKTVRG